MELCFEINNQKLTEIPNKDFLVNKTQNYLSLNFSFSSEWDGFLKYVILKDTKNNAYLFHYNDEAIIVPSVVLKSKYFRVTCFGTNEDVRITTNEITVNVHSSGYTQNFVPIDPDHSYDVITEILEALDTKADIADISVVGFSGDYDDLLDIPASFPPAEHTHSASAITGLDSFAEVEIKKSFRVLNDCIRTYDGE